VSAFTQSPLNDPQRHRVYTMEHECFGGAQRAPIQLKHARELAAIAAKSWKVRKPRVMFGGIPDGSEAVWFGPNLICLTRGRSSVFSLVHELAHHIQFHIAKGEYEDHGPQFVGIQMLTLDLLQLLPIALMETACRTYGVSYVHPLTGKRHKPRGSARGVVRVARASP
jgi:hypothetical protein